MLNFQFYNPARIIFGKGEEKNVGKYTVEYGKRVLLHYGGGSIKKNGLYDNVIKALKEYDIEIIELGGVCPNPVISLVRKGIEICKNEKIDFILAVGGGSVIDSAKAIAAGAETDDDIWEYFMDRDKKIKSALPLGVILTIPATGSESSTSSVITNDENLFKRSIKSTEYIPKFSILNPELTFTLPKYQVACGCSDILSHLMERYFTQVDKVDFTDRLLEASMKTVILNAPIAVNEQYDYNIMAEIMWVGTLAHNGLLNTGRIGDWASHHIEHELSALYNLTHGAGLSIITPAWIKYVYKENIDKFIQFAHRVFDIDFAYNEKERIITEMIKRLENWYKSLDLPIRLSEVEIDSSDFKKMAEKCLVGRGTTGNFKKLGLEDICNIYKLAL